MERLRMTYLAAFTRFMTRDLFTMRLHHRMNTSLLNKPSPAIQLSNSSSQTTLQRLHTYKDLLEPQSSRTPCFLTIASRLVYLAHTNTEFALAPAVQHRASARGSGIAGLDFGYQDDLKRARHGNCYRQDWPRCWRP